MIDLINYNVCKLCRLIDLVDLSSSELRLQTARERELEQQLKQSDRQVQQLKDDNSQLQQLLHSATDRETSLQQQLQQSQAELKQRDDLIKKGEDDTKKEEKLQADLKEASDTERDLRRQITELLQQQQQAAEYKAMEDKEYKGLNIYTVSYTHLTLPTIYSV